LTTSDDSYSAAIDALDPVGYWRLNGGGGDDETGTTDATFHGATAGVDGPFDNVATQAAQFDGTDDYIEIPDADAWQLPEGTVQFWFNPADVNGRQGLLGRDASGQSEDGHFSLYLQGDDLKLRIQDTDSSNLLTSANSVSAGSWHHVAVSFGDEGVEVYLDGALVMSDSFTGGIAGNENPWVIGALNWSSSEGDNDGLHSFFDGQIAEVALFDQQLSEAQVTNLVDAGETNVELTGDVIGESIAAGTVVGTVQAVDPGEDGALSYSLTDDAGGRFSIDGSGDLSLDAAHDGSATATDSITIRTTGSGGDNYDETFQVSLGSSGAETIDGGTETDIVYGLGGDDAIDAGAGDDLVYGGSGDDTIQGGEGTDVLYGDDGADLFILLQGQGNDTVSGGDGGGWTDTIELRDASGGDNIGDYGSDWTLALDSGSIESSDTNSSNGWLDLTDDAAGTITLQDGTEIDFTGVEHVQW